MSEYPAEFLVSDLDGSNGFMIQGANAGDELGWVSSAGDVNGDGISDILIAAPFADANGTDSGVAYVVFGDAAGFGANVGLSSLDGSNGFRLVGSAHEMIGLSLAGAGDFNGDGYDDVVLGTSNHSYLVFGGASGFSASIDLTTLNGSDGFRIDSATGEDFAGRHVAGAGDVNGDGFADLIIGGYFGSPNGNGSGESFVVFGTASTVSPTFSLADLDGSNGFAIAGENAGDGSGHSVASAGDVNGDGFDDILVGADYNDANGSNAGASYLIFGKASGFDTTLQLSDLDGANGFKLLGAAAVDQNGRSVASAGDVNGDGYADILVNSWRASPSGEYSGASYVVFGKAGGFPAAIDLGELDGTDGFKISGANFHDFLGYSAASAGDFNGDGFADVIVGAFGLDSYGEQSGGAYVIFGGASMPANIDVSTLNGDTGFRIDGAVAGSYTGQFVSGAGDVNNDGFDDVMIGADHSANGNVYVVYGGIPGEAVVRTGTAIANTIHGSDFNDTLSGLGGDDKLIGHAGDDILSGAGGKDRLVGDVGDDTLLGGKGGDSLLGGAGNDSLFGEAGNDALKGGTGDDTLNGGDGIDTANYSNVDAGVVASLATGTASGATIGSDTLIAIEDIDGGNGADALSGDGGDNGLSGNAGDDDLSGASGRDVLDGGDGNDTLTGGADADRITGGTGNDTFVYAAAADSTGVAYDTVMFDTAGDLFDLSSAVTGVDSRIKHASLSAATFDSNLSAAADAAHLHANHAVILKCDAGDLAGKLFLLVDLNGVAGYQAGQDLVIRMDHSTELDSLSTANFT